MTSRPDAIASSPFERGLSDKDLVLLIEQSGGEMDDPETLRPLLEEYARRQSLRESLVAGFVAKGSEPTSDVTTRMRESRKRLAEAGTAAVWAYLADRTIGDPDKDPAYVSEEREYTLLLGSREPRLADPEDR
jgi:hypothetical protein